MCRAVEANHLAVKCYHYTQVFIRRNETGKINALVVDPLTLMVCWSSYYVCEYCERESACVFVCAWVFRDSMST